MPFYYMMPKGPDGKRIADGLLRLRARLDAEIPVRTREETLLLATWNIRELDSAKYGSRLDDSFFYIAEIASRFDLIAVQEVRSDLSGLDTLKRRLGFWWKYLVTDVTAGTRGNQERMAFLYDSRKVRFGGLAGEIVLPPITEKGPDGTRITRPVEQLYRTPYVAAFEAGWFKFLLSTVHIQWGNAQANSPDRVREISSVARFLQNRAVDPNAWSPNLILLGDFNIFARDDDTFAAIVNAGFTVPQELQTIPGSNVARDRMYDQIAFSTSAKAAVACASAGVFDFFDTVYREGDEAMYAPIMGEAYTTTSSGKPRKKPSTYYKAWRTFQMSDHLPMWVELKVDFGERYLKAKAGG